MSRSIPIMMTALLLAGCGLSDSLKGEREHISYYTLCVDFTEQTPGDSGHVAIEDFNSERPAAWLQFTRRANERTLAYSVYPENHRWWAMPPVLATDMTIRRLRGHFRKVSRFPGTTRADLVVRGRLLQFEEIRDDGSAEGTAVVALRIAVRRRGRHVATFITRGTAKIAHQDADTIDGPAIARGMSEAMMQAIDQAAEKIKSLL